jgi:hypothetical protein
MDDRVNDEFHRLRMEHLEFLDRGNNHSCFNVEGCKDCHFTYNSRYSFGCSNCDAVIDCVACVNCKNCAYCVGLLDAEYQILNVQYEKDDYFKRLEEIGVDPNVDAM